MSNVFGKILDVKTFRIKVVFVVLQAVHVAGQCGGGGKVQCLWTGCKVYGALSSSNTWLTSHVTSHSGSKPFRCIVDACRQRFASQVSIFGTTRYIIPVRL
jgi:hypothetical protein